MTVLIIEDELPAANRLQDLIWQHEQTVQIEGPLDSNEAVLQWFNSNGEPDLIFSDIELLDGPVFYALEQLALSVPIIFTTAYNQYALEAFQTSGISYLLKPFKLEELSKAMEKFRKLQKNFQRERHQQLIAALKEVHTSKIVSYKSRLVIKLSQGIYLLRVKDVTCIQTHHGVAYAYRVDGKKFPISEKLADLQEQLDPNQFFRINRSELIQVEYIEKVDSYFNDRLAINIKGQKKELITSAARTSAFRKWLQEQ